MAVSLCEDISFLVDHLIPIPEMTPVISEASFRKKESDGRIEEQNIPRFSKGNVHLNGSYSRIPSISQEVHMIKERFQKSKTMNMTVSLLSCAFLLGCTEGKSSITSPSMTPKPNGLKDCYRDYFDIGAAIQYQSIQSGRYEDLLPNFSTLTPENDMKWGKLEKEKGQFTYEGADIIVDYAKSNGKKVRGHTLLWHKSLPDWVKEECATKEKALALIDRHIDETMGHFKDGVYCYDVVNEALHNTITDNNLDNGDYYRHGTSEISGSGTMDWYSLCGFDFIRQAFLSADQARKKWNLDDVKLYYNDYSLNSPNKRKAAVKMIQRLQKENIAIDGIGMQAHYQLKDYLADSKKFMTNFEESIQAFTGLGIDVEITEFDIRTNDGTKKDYDVFPKETEEQQAKMYQEIYSVCRKYSLPWTAGAGTLNNVTTWGIADDHTPHSTATKKDYPLLFHVDHTQKLAVAAIKDFSEDQ